jgi:hypothetical protein
MIYVYILLILLGISLSTMIFLFICIFVIINYPKLKICKWIKKHIITDQDFNLPI